jgi:hypothetical protein
VEEATDDEDKELWTVRKEQMAKQEARRGRSIYVYVLVLVFNNWLGSYPYIAMEKNYFAVI